MAIRKVDIETAFRDYLAKTNWPAYEDAFETAEYIPGILQQFFDGLPEAEEESLGELFSRIYHQERPTSVVMVTLRPLLMA